MKFDVRMISALLAMAWATGCKTTQTGEQSSHVMSLEEFRNLPASQLVALLVDLQVKSIDADGTVAVPTNKVDQVVAAAKKDGLQVQTGGSLAAGDTTKIKLIESGNSVGPTFETIQLAKLKNDVVTPESVITSKSVAMNKRLEDLIRMNPPKLPPGGGPVSDEDYKRHYDKGEYTQYDRTISGMPSQVLLGVDEIVKLQLPELLIGAQRLKGQ